MSHAQYLFWENGKATYPRISSMLVRYRLSLTLDMTGLATSLILCIALMPIYSWMSRSILCWLGGGKEQMNFIFRGKQQGECMSVRHSASNLSNSY